MIELFQWLNDEVWSRLKNEFFAGLPPVVKSIIPGMVRKQVVKALYGKPSHLNIRIYWPIVFG